MHSAEGCVQWHNTYLGCGIWAQTLQVALDKAFCFVVLLYCITEVHEAHTDRCIHYYYYYYYLVSTLLPETKIRKQRKMSIFSAFGAIFVGLFLMGVDVFL